MIKSLQPIVPRVDKSWNCLAKALYDNVAETPDELAFRRGDILTVLEQNPGGLEGWWLCSLRGRQGIAPGNRLRIIPGTFDLTGLGFCGNVTTSHGGSATCLNVKSPSLVSISNTQVMSFGNRRRSWDINPNRIVSLEVRDNYDVPIQANAQIAKYKNIENLNGVKKVSDEISSYDVPPPSNKLISSENLNYDIPSSSRSSGIITSLSSSSSSPPSSTGSRSSLDASLSLSSFGGSNRSSLEHPASDLYDIPPEPRKVVEKCNSDSPTTGLNLSPNSKSDLLLSSIPPPPGKTSTIQCLKQQNNCLLACYDIPSNNPQEVLAIDQFYDIPKNSNSNYSSCGGEQQKSSPLSKLSPESSSSKESLTHALLPTPDRLNISINEALEKQTKFVVDVQSAINELFKFVTGTNWRSPDNLAGRLNCLKNTCYNLRSLLQEFLEFGYGALANSADASDKSLSHKLSKMLKQLNDSYTIINSTTKSIDEKGWSLDNLAIVTEDQEGRDQVDGWRRKKTPTTPDELDQLIACSRGLIEDVKHVGLFLKGNIKLIFAQINGVPDQPNKPLVAPKPPTMTKPAIVCRKPPPPAPKMSVQTRPLPPVPVPKKCNHVDERLDNFDSSSQDEDNDYDYIVVESKNSVQFKKSFNETEKLVNKENNVMISENEKNSIKQSLNENGELLEKNSESKSEQENTESNQMHANDKQVLEFYLIQLESNKQTLTKSIEVFLQTIDSNQPPKIFMKHSKLVVIAANKMLYVGETVHRNLTLNDVRSKISKCTNSLNELLKSLVDSTKKAALQFPSVTAVNAMAANAIEVSQCANELNLVIIDAVKN